MVDKSFISVADHQYDDPLSYESSRSSEFYSDEPDDEHIIKPLPDSIHEERNRRKKELLEDYMSDSKNSDEQFLECESDFESPNRYNNPFVDYETLVDIYRDKKKLDSKRSNVNGKNDPKTTKSDDIKADEKITSESPRSQTTKSLLLGSTFGLGNVHKKSESQGKADQKDRSTSKSNRGGKGITGIGEDKVDRNSSFSDQMIDAVVSEMGSEVNSDLESRIIDYHEAKKNAPGYVEEGEGMGHESAENDVYKPEDEVDQLFDRVINGGYDPEFTFMPEALDPYVKMSKKLTNRKRKGNHEGNKNRDIADTVINTAMTILGTKDDEQTASNDQESAETSVGDGTKVDPSLVEPSLVQTIPSSDLVLEKTPKSDENNDIRDVALSTSKLEKSKKFKEVEEPAKFKPAEFIKPSHPILRKKSMDREVKEVEFEKTDSDIEKERERARMLFEATKDEETLYRRNTDDLSTGLKVLKLREDKKSKKSKHRKPETRTETETEEEKPKKDKKGDEKGSKHNTSKIDKSEDKSDKSDKAEKSEKGSKDKKSDKSKKSSWRSNDYDIIFSSLGESFSSGVIELDSKPIVLSKKGFYTIFLRNSKYPYDSTIDFYLFRVGVKYMLVNEVSSQNFNIDDVVDYGNFRIKLSGNINLSPNVTKMALIYSNSGRQTLEFALTPPAFDSKPKIMYKLFYSGPLQSIPMPIKFRRRLRVLSLDNSENLGTSVIGALYLLEKKLSEMKKKKVNLADYFDYICGTGSGALIALCMLKGYSMKDLRSQWNVVVSSLFKWTYSLPSGIIFDYYYIEEFKKNFINILGTDFLCSKPWPHCMVTCTNVRSNPYDLFLFRNYGDSKFGSIYGSSYAPMWLVGWASCALPTYVRGPSNSNLDSIGYNMISKTQLVDGSLVSSSPSLISLQELTNIYNINLRSLVKDNMDLFLSIGTSKSENDNASINSSTWQILMSCKNLMYNTQLQHLHVKNLFDEYENKYHRIQLPIYPGCKHGKTSKEAVDAVLTSTIQFISRHDNQRIEQIVNILNQ
ncbi:patatin-family phospholipase [Theileria orientalis]|uniref:Patatin-family phospholipase n=1 Tax=Theileria orientalis TaxID=68886 RepID=A0A976MA64_THEOR|nr:patatin-family phospholipase [Theileria orientalis]